jgi:hypothetical protein
MLNKNLFLVVIMSFTLLFGSFSNAHACHRYIVGYYVDEYDDLHGFVLKDYNSPISWTTLDYDDGVVEGIRTIALGVNDNYKVVGKYNLSGVEHGFIYDINSETYETFDHEHATTSTRIYSINDDGDMVGVIDYSQGFFYEASTKQFTDFDQYDETRATGINDSLEVVGHYNNNSAIRGFHYYDGSSTKIHYPNAANTKATDISNSSSGSLIVGFYVDSSSDTHGFKYDWTTYTTIDNTTKESTWLYGINDENLVTAVCLDSSGDPHSYKYHLVNETFTLIQYPNAEETHVRGISNEYD